MIKYVTGNMFDSDAEALVNTVNTVGVMGKGIALQFKKRFPKNYKEYKNLCTKGGLEIGKLLVVEDYNITTDKKIIINFPTKKHWRNSSEYVFIEKGLDDLVRIIEKKELKSLALPPLGSGNGGLHWFKVKELINDKLASIENCDITVYEPNSDVKEFLKKERVRLTPARAMLLYMFLELVKEGEFVSEFAGEKLCYFLQKFGAYKYFKLNFDRSFYGPYSGKVRHILYHLNGSYLTGYEDKDGKPFEPLNLFVDCSTEVKDYIKKSSELSDIVLKTSNFLTGFYSSFPLELLSTVQYIADTKNITDKDSIKKELENWSHRKRTFISDDRYIDITLRQLEKHQLL